MDYPIKTPDQLGTVLRGFRRDRHLTQANVAAMIGLAQNAVSGIETDAGRSSVARIFKLLAALDVDLVLRSRQAPSKRPNW